jgi:hypothetical protein
MKIPCAFCGGNFRTYKLRHKHAKDCPHPEGKPKKERRKP